MKPDWAQGPEWEGWEAAYGHNLTVSKSSWNVAFHIRSLPENLEIATTLTVWHMAKEITLPCKSPEAARKADEALLEAME